MAEIFFELCISKIFVELIFAKSLQTAPCGNGNAEFSGEKIFAMEQKRKIHKNYCNNFKKLQKLLQKIEWVVAKALE